MNDDFYNRSKGFEIYNETNQIEIKIIKNSGRTPERDLFSLLF